MLQPHLFLKSLKRSFGSSTTCMTFLLSISVAASPVIAGTPLSPFGLGLDSFRGSGGAHRCATTMIGSSLTPEDGGRTLSTKPTFYVYVENLYGSQETPYRVNLILWDGVNRESKRIYLATGNGRKLGLINVTLPDDAPALQVGKDMKWQVRILFPDTNILFLNGAVRLDRNPEIEQAIHQSDSDLEKARIYARYYYWYDAFDAYSKWLELYPFDRIAMKERSTIMITSQIGITSSKLKCPQVTKIQVERIESQKAESIKLN